MTKPLNKSEAKKMGFHRYEIKYTVNYDFMLMYQITKNSKKEVARKLKERYQGKRVEIISIKEVNGVGNVEQILKENS